MGIDSYFTTHINNLFGNMMGTYNEIVPELLVIAFMILVVLCALSGDEGEWMSKYQRAVFAVVALSGIGIIYAFFVFGATPYGGDRSVGVQGKYFMPFIPPLLYSFYSDRIRIKLDRAKLFIPLWFLELGYVVSIMSNINYTV